MNTATILDLVKARLGISTNVRDAYLLAIIEGVVSELEDEKGITLSQDNASHLMFVVDYSTWRYENKLSEKGTPRHLQFRLHNLMLHNNRTDANA